MGKVIVIVIGVGVRCNVVAGDARGSRGKVDGDGNSGGSSGVIMGIEVVAVMELEVCWW